MQFLQLTWRKIQYYVSKGLIKTPEITDNNQILLASPVVVRLCQWQRLCQWSRETPKTRGRFGFKSVEAKIRAGVERPGGCSVSCQVQHFQLQNTKNTHKLNDWRICVSFNSAHLKKRKERVHEGRGGGGGYDLLSGVGYLRKKMGQSQQPFISVLATGVQRNKRVQRW